MCVCRKETNKGQLPIGEGTEQEDRDKNQISDSNLT